MHIDESTEKLVSQFTRDDDLIPAFTAIGIPKIEAVAGVTAMVATTFF